MTEACKVQSEAQGPSDEEQKALQRLAEPQRRAGSESSVRIACGPVDKTLLDQLRQAAAADVLVIGGVRGLSLVR